MGIVPWVSRFADESADEASAPLGKSAPLIAGAKAPCDVADLGEWLLGQRLVPIEFRGALHPVLGVAGAPLLVVLSQENTLPVAGSMTGDDGRLFELMLRSIALGNRDTRRCLLGNEPTSTSDISSLLTAQTRGVLVLMEDWSFDVSDVTVEQHRGRLPQSGLPVWRMAHPSIVLQRAMLKRQAWQVLKNIRAMLNGVAL